MKLPAEGGQSNLSWGVMATPALVDDEVVSVGRVRNAAEVKQLLGAR